MLHECIQWYFSHWFTEIVLSLFQIKKGNVLSPSTFDIYIDSCTIYNSNFWNEKDDKTHVMWYTLSFLLIKWLHLWLIHYFGALKTKSVHESFPRVSHSSLFMIHAKRYFLSQKTPAQNWKLSNQRKKWMVNQFNEMYIVNLKLHFFRHDEKLLVLGRLEYN